MTDFYKCDNCGACCRTLIIEIDELDIAREPLLKEACGKPARKDPYVDYSKDEDGDPLLPLVPGWEAGGILACGETHPCKLLGSDNLCTIYPTRPNCCVAFRAGSQQCQDARGYAGLGLLDPVRLIPLEMAAL